MQHSEVVAQLKNYIAEVLLDGEDIGLDESTPLLEWGVINSLEIMRLLGFVQERFHVEIPGESVVAEHFANLTVLADLVIEQAPEVGKR